MYAQHLICSSNEQKGCIQEKQHVKLVTENVPQVIFQKNLFQITNCFKQKFVPFKIVMLHNYWNTTISRNQYQNRAHDAKSFRKIRVQLKQQKVKICILNHDEHELSIPIPVVSLQKPVDHSVKIGRSPSGIQKDQVKFALSRRVSDPIEPVYGHVWRDFRNKLVQQVDPNPAGTVVQDAHIAGVGSICEQALNQCGQLVAR